MLHIKTLKAASGSPAGLNGDGITRINNAACDTDDDCDGNFSCHDISDELLCACNDGHAENDKKCSDINECHKRTGSNDCHHDATCCMYISMNAAEVLIIVTATLLVLNQ